MSTELESLQNSVTTSFSNKDSFEHIQRVATMFSKSDMVPKRFVNNVGNCVIALEIANRMGASPLMVMQNLDVIQGKPGWSSVFLIATLNSCGRFSPLRYEEDEVDGGRCRAWAYDKGTDEKLFGVWVTMLMAEAEGWVQKTGSKWKTMPQLMRRYRAASFFTKQFAPEVSMGLQTVEEIIDTTDYQGTRNAKGIDVNHEELRYEEIAMQVEEQLNKCDTNEEIEIIVASMDDELKVILAEKVEIRKSEINKK